ncbi:unnamed protein product [Rhodiola kirilowii]
MEKTGGCGIIFWVLLLLCFIMGSLSDSISRDDFPNGFVFGTASSAFQYEGAVNEGHKEIAYGIPSLENQGGL